MDATTYLQAELHKTQRTTKIALIAMGAVLIATIVYFQWMKSELTEILTPESVAELVINEARGALPGVTTQLKDNLTEQAPGVVHFVLSSAVDKVLPLVAQTFHTSLEEHSRNVSALGREHADAALGATLKNFSSRGARPRGEPPAVLGEGLAAHISAQFGIQLDAVARDAVTARLDKSGETLKHINRELVAMARGSAADRQSKLGQRLITTWWTFLDRGGANAAGPLPDSAGSATTTK